MHAEKFMGNIQISSKLSTQKKAPMIFQDPFLCYEEYKVLQI